MTISLRSALKIKIVHSKQFRPKNCVTKSASSLKTTTLVSSGRFSNYTGLPTERDESIVLPALTISSVMFSNISNGVL